MNFRFISAKENNLHFKKCFVRQHLHQLGFMVSVEPQTRKKVNIRSGSKFLVFVFSMFDNINHGGRWGNRWVIRCNATLVSISWQGLTYLRFYFNCFNLSFKKHSWHNHLPDNFDICRSMHFCNVHHITAANATLRYCAYLKYIL